MEMAHHRTTKLEADDLKQGAVIVELNPGERIYATFLSHVRIGYVPFSYARRSDGTKVDGAYAARFSLDRPHDGISAGREISISATRFHDQDLTIGGAGVIVVSDKLLPGGWPSATFEVQR